jgi:DNA-binding NarL/FixJ family response regulator
MNTQETKPQKELTRQQKRVWAAVTQLGFQGASKVLKKSERTLEWHMYRISKTLGTNNRHEQAKLLGIRIRIERINIDSAS